MSEQHLNLIPRHGPANLITVCAPVPAYETRLVSLDTVMGIGLHLKGSGVICANPFVPSTLEQGVAFLCSPPCNIGVGDLHAIY